MARCHVPSNPSEIASDKLVEIVYLRATSITFSRLSYFRISGRPDREYSLATSIVNPALSNPLDKTSASKKCSDAGRYWRVASEEYWLKSSIHPGQRTPSF